MTSACMFGVDKALFGWLVKSSAVCSQSSWSVICIQLLISTSLLMTT